MVNIATPVYITVRAQADNIGNDISRAMRGSRSAVSRDAQELGRAFTRGFNRGVDVNAFSRVSNGIRSMVPEAEAARKSLASLVRTSYTLGTALTMVVGGASAAVSAIGALGGAAIGASSTVSVLGNALFALGAGMVAVKLATSGVGGALQKLNQQTAKSAATNTRTALQQVRDNQAREAAIRRIDDAERALGRTIEANRDRMASANAAVTEAQNDLNQAIREGREELQQLGFEAEDAALAEKKAAIELERARETLQRVQDLPPNSRGRREAELAFAEAELNYRKAKDANADLAAEQERLARVGVNGVESVVAARERLADAEIDRAKAAQDAMREEEDAVRNLAEARQDAANVDERQDATGDGGAGAATGAAVAAWDEGLNQYQRAFALFLNGLRPQFAELELIASRAFLPQLETAIRTLMERAFPVISTGIGLVAGAMGGASIELANVITRGENLDKLTRVFESSATLIEIFGQTLGSVYDILMSILDVTAPLAEQFFGFINEQMGEFAEHLNSPAGRQELIDFFAKASETAQLFGDVFGNIFAGIGGIVNANLGPDSGAGILLTELARVTSDWGNSDGLNQFFKDVATNSVQIFGSLGDLLGILGRIGADQSIGEAFAALREGAPFLENILQTAVDAAPAFAGLVTTITGIMSALADTGAMQVFFDVLNGIFTAVYDFVSAPANKAFLDFFGRIFAFFSAIGLIIAPLLFGLKAFAGIILSVTTVFGVLRSLFPIIIGAMRALNAVFLANPIGLIVTALTVLISTLVWFFTETELGKEIWANFTRFLGEAWENTTKWIGEALENIGKFFTDVITNVVSFVQDHWGLLLSLIIGPLGLVIQWIVENWTGIVKFFEDVWNNIIGFFIDAWLWIDQYVIQPFKLGMQLLGLAFEIIGNFIGDVWENIRLGIAIAWAWIERYIFLPIKLAIAEIQKYFELMQLGISIAWQALQDGLALAWKWIDDNVFSPIKDAVGYVQDAFELVAEGIAIAWDGIKKAAADPINFVIDTVYNNGLRSFWNDIAGALNMNDLKLPKVPKIAFASGGVMPGYSPGKDIHKFYSPTGGILHLSGGEAIMRPEWTRAVGGPAAVERMNRAARRGQAFSSGGTYSANVGRTQRFASGGVVDFAGDLFNNLANIGKIVADFFADPKSAVKKHIVDGVIKPMTSGMGDGLFSDLISEVPVTIAGWVGENVKKIFGETPPGDGKPANAMGWQAQWNIVKAAFPDTKLNSAYYDRIGGKTYHGKGRAIDVPPRMDIFNYLRSNFPNSTELIYSPANNRQLRNGKSFNWGEPVRSAHFNHVHWAMAKGGTVYPSKDGSIVRVAEAGKPERVEPLDPNGISERDKAIIDYLSNGGGAGTTINVYMQPDEDPEAFAHRVSRILSRDVRMGGTH